MVKKVGNPWSRHTRTFFKYQNVDLPTIKLEKEFIGLMERRPPSMSYMIPGPGSISMLHFSNTAMSQAPFSWNVINWCHCAMCMLPTIEVNLFPHSSFSERNDWNSVRFLHSQNYWHFWNVTCQADSEWSLMFKYASIWSLIHLPDWKPFSET